MHVHGATLSPGDLEFTAEFTNALDRARRIAASAGAGLVLLDLPCLPNVSSARQAEFNQMLETYDSVHHDVDVLRWSDILCPDGKAAEHDGQPLRPDGVHFDDASAKYVGELIGPQIRERALQSERP
jgi:hypothetical protein